MAPLNGPIEWPFSSRALVYQGDLPGQNVNRKTAWLMHKPSLIVAVVVVVVNVLDANVDQLLG